MNNDQNGSTHAEYAPVFRLEPGKEVRLATTEEALDVLMDLRRAMKPEWVGVPKLEQPTTVRYSTLKRALHAVRAWLRMRRPHDEAVTDLAA